MQILPSAAFSACRKVRLAKQDMFHSYTFANYTHLCIWFANNNYNKNNHKNFFLCFKMFSSLSFTPAIASLGNQMKKKHLHIYKILVKIPGVPESTFQCLMRGLCPPNPPFSKVLIAVWKWYKIIFFHFYNYFQSYLFIAL